LFTTNPTWPDQGANPGLSSGKPAINCLTCGSAWRDVYILNVVKVDYLVQKLKGTDIHNAVISQAFISPLKKGKQAKWS
jgi:hypothetical protein